MPHHNFKGAKTNKGLGLAFLLIKLLHSKALQNPCKSTAFPTPKQYPHFGKSYLFFISL